MERSWVRSLSYVLLGLSPFVAILVCVYRIAAIDPDFLLWLSVNKPIGIAVTFALSGLWSGVWGTAAAYHWWYVPVRREPAAATEPVEIRVHQMV